MDGILLIRTKIVLLYKRFETFFDFIAKFAAGAYIFNWINGIGYYRTEFDPLFKTSLAFPLTMLMSLLFTLAPATVANLLVCVALVVQISVAFEASVYLSLLLILLLVFYCRLAPKSSYLILAIIIGYHFKIPYAVVMFGGLYFGLSAIIPIAVGILIHHMIPFFQSLVQQSVQADFSSLNLMTLPTSFLDTYKLIYEGFTASYDWMFTAFIFSVVILCIYAVSRLEADYITDIALGAGFVLNILGFITGNIIMDINYSILPVILYSLLSLALVEVVKFFDTLLDYKRTEKVRFEDNENYYYMTIIPKILLPEAQESEPAPSKPEMLAMKKSKQTVRSGEMARAEVPEPDIYAPSKEDVFKKAETISRAEARARAEALARAEAHKQAEAMSRSALSAAPESLLKPKPPLERETSFRNEPDPELPLLRRRRSEGLPPEKTKSQD